MSGSVKFTATVKINLHVSLQKVKSVGVTLSGDMSIGLNSKFNPSTR